MEILGQGGDRNEHAKQVSKQHWFKMSLNSKNERS